MAVIDAIGALSKTDCPTGIWEELKRSHPQIANICSDHCFSREGNTPVADSESWEIIQNLLLDHLIDNEIRRDMKTIFFCCVIVLGLPAKDPITGAKASSPNSFDHCRRLVFIKQIGHQ